jgi:hypothetical protein
MTPRGASVRLRRQASSKTFLRALLTTSVAASLVATAFLGAAAASARPDPGGPGPTNHWRVTGHGKKYNTGGKWHNCAAYSKRSYSYTLGCSFAESVGNTVSGTVGVSDGTLSETVGYSVTRTKTVTATGSFTIKAGTAGHIQYHQTYVGTPVYQTLYRCQTPGYTKACTKIGKATAYTHKWEGTEFRKV